jgi:hypothetical protein
LFREVNMTMIARLFAAAVIATVTASATSAQQPQTVRLRGTIEGVDGQMLIVKAPDGAELKIALADTLQVFRVAKGSFADIKPGAFIGVGAMPQPDGSQRAIRITIFPEALRGVGEGFRPWDQPNSTMTNGAVDTVAGVQGNELLVKYKGGEKKIVVPPDATILAYGPADKSDLKPGVAIAINNAAKQPDGSFQASRLNVGRSGLVPQ